MRPYHNLLCCLCLLGTSGFVGSAAQAVEYRGGALPSTINPNTMLRASSQTLQKARPNSIDLSHWMPPVGNQAGSNSCVAWAIAYGVKSYQENRELGWNRYDPNHQFSPMWIYNQINGGRDEGSYASDAFNLLLNQGCPRITEFHTTNPFQQPPAHTFNNTMPFRMHSYQWMEHNSSLVKDTLLAGHVVILRFLMYDDVKNLNHSNPVFDNLAGRKPGNNEGHVVVITGYDDTRQAFRFQNSWGTTWGINGFGWISYNMVNNLGNQAGLELIVCYDRPTDKLTLQRWASQQGGFWDTQKWLSGDFNGDGLTDAAKVFWDAGMATIDVHPSRGGDFIIQRWATRQGGFADNQQWFVGDFNGDGRDDLAKAFNDAGMASIDVHLSTGSGFIHQRWATRQGGFWDGQRWMAGDFNGDGRDDCAKAFNDGGFASIDVHPSTGGSFWIQRWATRQGGFWSGMQWFTGDFNGDGRDDCAKAFGEAGMASIDVHLSHGYTLSLHRWTTRIGGFWEGQRWFALDANGDGRDDCGKAFAEVPGASIDIHGSTGYSFSASAIRWATQSGGFWLGQQWFTGDFNGDGYEEPAKAFGEHGQASLDVHPLWPGYPGSLTVTN